MPNYLKLLLLTALLILSGCSMTEYHALDSLGGYSEMRLAKDIYKVRYKGNSSYSKNLVEDYTLRRAAELTVKSGYKYFKVEDSNIDLKKYSYKRPVSISTNHKSKKAGAASSNDYRHNSSSTHGNSQSQSVHSEIVKNYTNQYSSISHRDSNGSANSSYKDLQNSKTTTQISGGDTVTYFVPSSEMMISLHNSPKQEDDFYEAAIILSNFIKDTA